MGRSLQEYSAERQQGYRPGSSKKLTADLAQQYSRDPSVNARLAAEQGNALHPGQGTVLGAPLTPEQQFEQERRALDPLTEDTAIPNPYVDTDHRTQRAKALMNDNRALARQAYGMRPGEEAYTIDPTQYEAMGWSPDERYSYEDQINQKRGSRVGLDAQTEALQGYRDIAEGQGLSAIDRAAITQSRLGREQELRANREAIMANAQEQGRAGGQAQLLAQMQGAQGTANLRAMDDLRTSALGLERRDQALGGMADVGQQVQTAQDAIDKFNAEGKRLIQERNIERKNKGIDVRYADEHDTRTKNVETKNRAEELNKSADYGKRGAYADQVNAIKDIQDNNAAQAAYETDRQNAILQQRQQKVANVIGGVGTVTSAGTSLLPLAFNKDKK